MPRTIALEALMRCRRDGAWSGQTLSALLERAQLAPRDAALASRLFYGTLQNLTLLDFYLAQYTKGKLEPKVRDILRLGAYQILFLDRVPDSAAVNESVELCKRCGLGRAKGLVNAVLRRVAAREPLEIPGRGSAPYLATRYSHPLWLVEELLAARGYDGAEAVLAADNEAVPTFIQTNTLKTTPEALAAELGAEPHPSLPGCLLLKDAAALSSPAFEEGRFYVQDPAAREAVTLCGAQPGMRVLDACAAPGGKSFAAAIDMGGKGFVLARDVSGAKLSLVADGAERLGLSCIDFEIADARTAPDENFDLVMADVPCSGLGVIRKKPDIRWRSPDGLAELGALQRAILENAAGAVKPGGTLAYSTCTWRAAENGGVTGAFLREHGEYTLELERTFWPDIDGTDGFYLCRMRRKNAI